MKTIENKQSKFIILLNTILLILSVLNVHAQNPRFIDPVNLARLDSVLVSNNWNVNDYHRKLYNREANEIFAKNTLYMSDLSYVTLPSTDWGSPKSPYILTADIIPQFVFAGRFSRLALHLTPRFKARIMSDNITQGDSSLPVRTPSYMPGGTLYYRLPNLNYHNYWHHLGLSFFHHSNGQDGPEIINGKFNTYNGNFSTNYVELGYNFLFKNTCLNQPDNNNKCFEDKKVLYEYYGKCGLEHHIVGIAENLKWRYGLTRLNFKIGTVVIKRYRDAITKGDSSIYITDYYSREWFRFVLNGTWIMGNRSQLPDDNAKKRINIDFTGYLRIKGSQNSAFLLSFGYWGSDPYNVYFENSYGFIRAGLSFGFFATSSNPNFKYTDIEKRP